MGEVPEENLGPLLSQAIAAGVQQSVAQVIQQMPGLVTALGVGPGTKDYTIRDAMAQSQKDFYDTWFKEESPSWFDDKYNDLMGVILKMTRGVIGEDAYNAAYNKFGAGPEMYDNRIQMGFKEWGAKAIADWFEQVRSAEHMGVKEVWLRCFKDYATSAALGATAHGISTIMSLRVFGTLGINMTGLAALVGKFAGFDSMTSAVQGEFYTAYLKTPLHYWFNKEMTPYLPPIADIQRFHYKRIDRPPRPSTRPGAPPEARQIEDLVGYTPPGRRGESLYRPELPDSSIEHDTADEPTARGAAQTFKVGDSDTGITHADAMRYAGYSEAWQKIYEDDLYREPGVRDLLLMIETGKFDDSWIASKLERLGYSDQDGPIMVDAVKRRGARTQIMDLYRRIWYAVERGYMTAQQFREEVEVCQFTSTAVDFGADAGEWGAFVREADEYVRTVREMYAKAQLSDDEFRNLLDAVLTNPGRVDNIVRMERAKRYRRVYLTTPTEDARSDLGKWRQLYVAGRITEPEYIWRMHECGFEPDTVELTLSVDQLKRDRQVLSQFRTYRLPNLRDQVLHGMVTMDEYGAQLEHAGFPVEYVPDELDLMRSKFTARQEGRVRSEQLAAYKRAYVLGLVGRAELRSVMEAAGVTEAGVRSQVGILDYQRRELERREAERRARQEIPVETEAVGDVEAIVRELAARRAKAMGLTEQWAKLKSEEARDQIRPIADKLIAELRKGPDADAGLVASLSAEIKTALWWSKVAEA